MKTIKNNNCDNGKDRERQYQENMKADQCMLQMFSYLFSQPYCAPFYPYSYPMLSQTDWGIKQHEDYTKEDC